jgi:hypothetical protein
MSQTTTIDHEKLQKWIHEHKEAEQIQEDLIKEGFDEATIDLYIKEFKKQYYAGRQKIGFRFLMIGAFIGFVSCLLSIANPFPSLYEVILYGATSLSICVIFVGLYYLFE